MPMRGRLHRLSRHSLQLPFLLQVNLSWTATTGTPAATGYHVFRNGVQVSSLTGTGCPTPTGTSTAYSDDSDGRIAPAICDADSYGELEQGQIKEGAEPGGTSDASFCPEQILRSNHNDDLAAERTSRRGKSFIEFNCLAANGLGDNHEGPI